MKIRLLLVEFNETLEAYEIDGFRAAVIKKAGLENVLFHHHIDDKQYLYQYPLIQYKTIGRRPALLCVQQGVDEVHHFFNNSDWTINVNGRSLNLTIHNLQLKQYNVQEWESDFLYRIRNWLPLNQKNYDIYKTLTSDIDRTAMLEKIIIGNILTFAKGIGWSVGKQIKVKIDGHPTTRLVSVKGVKRESFTLTFTCNISLPNHIGLGRNVSRGFGTIRQINSGSDE